MKGHAMRTRNQQYGLTLLEVIVSLAVLSAAFVGVSALIDDWSNDMHTSVVAQQTSTFGEAVQAYVKDNYAAVSAVATATTPALIRVSTLTGTGYLESGFSVSNSYGQNICALVLQPSAGKLNALVVTEGGTAINDLDLGSIAAKILAAGGGIYSTAATTVRGTMGGWSMPIGNFANPNQAGLHCDGTAGTVSIAPGHSAMALWFNDGDSTSAFLYRNDIGQPQLNTMNTPIIMAATETVGAACSTTGAIARDVSGAVVSCQGGSWKTQGSIFWQDPVANFAALPACAAAIAWQTRVVETPTTGTGPRAYTCNGTTWQPLAVDDTGNITIAGTATIDKLAGNLQITATATENAACSPNGRIASDATGLILSCQSGVWTPTHKQPDYTMIWNPMYYYMGNNGGVNTAIQSARTSTTGEFYIRLYADSCCSFYSNSAEIYVCSRTALTSTFGCLFSGNPTPYDARYSSSGRAILVGRTLSIFNGYAGPNGATATYASGTYMGSMTAP